MKHKSILSTSGKHGLCTTARLRLDRLTPVVVCAAIALAVIAPPALVVGQQPSTGNKQTPKQIKPGEKTTPTAKPRIQVGPMPGGAGAALVVDQLVHDFGETWIGPPLEHTFRITNTGQTTLNIIKVKPSCGCTKKGVMPKTIEPGQTADFPFTIDSKKLRGKYTKPITITTNDPNNASIKLTLKGVCKRYVKVEPPNAFFNRIKGTQEQEKVLTITNNTEGPLELALVDPPATSKFTYEIVPIDPGKKFELRIRTKPPILPGSIKEQVTLTTNMPGQDKLTIRVNALVPSRLEVKPSPLYLRAGAKPRPITFVNNGDTPVTVLEATIDEPLAQVKVDERTPGKRYSITVTFPDGYKLPDSGRIIRLATDDLDKPIIEVPIKSVARPKSNQRKKRAVELLVGKPAPKFDAITVAGAPVSNATVGEKITILNFFANNCGYCKKQMPRLEPLRKEFEQKGVRFVMVNQTMRGKQVTEEQAVEKVKSMGLGAELVYDPTNTIGKAFKATGYPTLVIVGKKGLVQTVSVGNKANLESNLRKELNRILAGKPIPPQNLASNSPTTPRKRTKRPAELLVGKKIPGFSALTTAGVAVSNATAGEQVTVLNFFANNCGYCTKQMPRLESLRKKYEAKGVRFIMVGQTMRNKTYTEEQTTGKLKKLGVGAELIYDPTNTIGKVFKSTSYPTLVMLGKGGLVQAVAVGNKANLESFVSGELDRILAGKPIPGQAGKAKPTAQRTFSGSFLVPSGKP